MDLLDKVRLIIGNKCESPSQFADEIDVPRSAISHLLNGRNKPSLDVIRKIVRRFPELGTDWILEDEKMPVLSGGLSSSKLAEKPATTPHEPIYGKPLDLFSSASPGPEFIRKNVAPDKVAAQDRKVVRVLIFFSDGTFEELGGSD